LLIGLLTSNPISHAFMVDFVAAQLGFVIASGAYLVMARLRDRR
jgi:hypothetical protein